MEDGVQKHIKCGTHVPIRHSTIADETGEAGEPFTPAYRRRDTRGVPTYVTSVIQSRYGGWPTAIGSAISSGSS